MLLQRCHNVACYAERALRQSGGEEVSPVVTSQGRVTRAPRRLRITDAGYGELGPADRLAPGRRCIGGSLQGCAGCRARAYGPRRPANKTEGFEKGEEIWRR